MKILKKIYNKTMKGLILAFILLFSYKAFSIVGHDDRFYIHGTKWADLLNGIVQINESCTGFVLEGDIVLSAAHCFNKVPEIDENGMFKKYHPLIKDFKIDYKKLKYMTVSFGDANIDTNDKSEKTHFNESSELYSVKDLFLGYNPKELYVDSRDTSINDYVLIKLKDPIPKNIKRFKLFNADLLKDYDILKHSYRGNLSTAGFHGDTTKTIYQRMAHIGCKVRDLKQYKKVWIEYSDCDFTGGASGSPLFYILKHKKTKKIELALRSIMIEGNFSEVERKLEYKSLLKDKQKQRYQLGWGEHYRSSVYLSVVDHSANGSLLLTNHKEFLTNLKNFKKDSSFFRNKKIKSIYNKYYDETWILKNIQKKSLKELKEFLYKTYLKLKNKDIEFLSGFDDKVFWIHHGKKNLPKEKLELLEDFISYSESDTLKVRKFYETRPKNFSYEKLTELEDKFKRKDPDTYEDTINDKEKAQKLWDMYFPKKKSTWLKDLFF